ncbi:MAG: methyltransferase domain-containing protein [Eubacteriales bacterium]|nr:methyltransferase domain-containing protein [Eubacteriales bacterium]
MLTKVGSKVYDQTPELSVHPRLSMMERALLKWAVIDRDDKVLDAGLGNGIMVDYLIRNLECEVCGVSDNMELVRRTRNLVQSADLVYASKGDIPWHDEAFDTVFLRAGHRGGLEKQLVEIKRVLKSGGQLVIGIDSYPAVVRGALRLLSDEVAQEDENVTRKEVQAALSELGFEFFSWQRMYLFGGVLICWKHGDAVEKLLKDE